MPSETPKLLANCRADNESEILANDSTADGNSGGRRPPTRECGNSGLAPQAAKLRLWPRECLAVASFSFTCCLSAGFWMSRTCTCATVKTQKSRTLGDPCTESDDCVDVLMVTLRFLLMEMRGVPARDARFLNFRTRLKGTFLEPLSIQLETQTFTQCVARLNRRKA